MMMMSLAANMSLNSEEAMGCYYNNRVKLVSKPLYILLIDRVSCTVPNCKFGTTACHRFICDITCRSKHFNNADQVSMFS